MNSSNTSRPKRQALWQTLPLPRQRQLLAILADWTLRRWKTLPAPVPTLPKGEKPHEPGQS